MHLLSAEDIGKQFDDRPLFEALSFSLEQGERVGVIGRNGSGKSTLLRIVAGVERADQGRVAINGTARVAYLPQNPEMPGELSVIDYVFRGEGERMRLMRAYEETVEALRVAPGDAVLLDRMAELGAQMEAIDAWEVERHAKSILQRLGITDLAAQLHTLSGGQRRRVALASTLIDPSDLLILDEPTNHLDADTVAWLETELQRSSAALLLVTHDRYFLDRVVKRILALEGGKLWVSAGGYREYVHRRAERLQAQATSDQRREAILRRELEWMLQGAQARSTKQKARIERFESLRDEPQSRASATMQMSVAPAQRLGKRVIELEALSKRYGERTLFHDLTLSIGRMERLGIVGPNASGKTTLLNLIAGVAEPDTGAVIRGETVRLAYYDQESTALNLQQRVIDYLEEAAPLVHTADGSVVTAAQMLERFLFDAKAQYARIGTLSGGERRRLYLLRMLLFAPNVLLLDEPTNDLDIDTLQILEDYLDGWESTLLVASHDRYFLDRTVDQLLLFEGGTVRTFPGSYSVYAAARAQKQPEPAGRDVKVASPPQHAPPATKRRALSYKERRELEGIQARIAALEAEQRRLNGLLSGGETDYKRMEEWSNQLVQASDELEKTLERWMELEELASS